MATTKTTQIANAISLLSDVLSAEVAEGNHFLEDEDDSVSLEDFDEVKDNAASFVTDQIDGLESVKHEIEDEIGTGGIDAWDVEDDEEDEDEYEEDDVGNGTVVVEGESDEATDDEADEEDAGPTDAEKLEILMAAGEELEDQIAELEAEKEALKNALTSVLSGVDDLIDAAESYQTEIEAY